MGRRGTRWLTGGADEKIIGRDLASRHTCKLGLEGIVSKRKASSYRSGRTPDWLKMKNPAGAAVEREADEDWGR